MFLSNRSDAVSVTAEHNSIWIWFPLATNLILMKKHLRLCLQLWSQDD